MKPYQIPRVVPQAIVVTIDEKTGSAVPNTSSPALSFCFNGLGYMFLSFVLAQVGIRRHTCVALAVKRRNCIIALYTAQPTV